MGLFRPAWKSSRVDRALEAVQSVSSQSVLADIVKNARHTVVKVAAAKRISDQPLLIEIARTVGDTAVLKIVIESLTDEDTLNEIARSTDKEKYHYVHTREWTETVPGCGSTCPYWCNNYGDCDVTQTITHNEISVHDLRTLAQENLYALQRQRREARR
jgi:hypothetical protein